MFFTSLLKAQSLFYIVMGAWPLVPLRSFLYVTGPKKDIWLLNTVSWLILAVGAALAVTCLEESYSLASLVLAVLTSAFLAGIDIYFSHKKVISKVYLFDAGVEILFLIGLLLSFQKAFM